VVVGVVYRDLLVVRGTREAAVEGGPARHFLDEEEERVFEPGAKAFGR
jgi:hypothetical protein